MQDLVRRRVAALPEPLRQFLAYATIGACTTSLDAVMFAAIVATLGWSGGARAVVASTLSYGAASAVAYVLNSRITFRGRHQGDSLATITRFAATFAASALLAAGVFAVVESRLAGTPPALAAAKAASIATVVIWNFVLLRRWVFPGAAIARPWSPAIDSRAIVRRCWWWGVPLVVAVAARVWFDVASSALRPRSFPDTTDYLQIAAQPFSAAHLFYPKPPLVPIIYRWLGGDSHTIVTFQHELAFWSWFGLGIVLFACARRPAGRLAGLGVALAFMLAPLRIGWTGVLLSESINDSLLAVLLAVGVLLATVVPRSRSGRRRTLLSVALGIALFVVGLAWVLARDTNAVTVLVAAPVSWLIWSLRGDVPLRWAAPATAIAVLVAVFALWTTQVTPRYPTGLTVTQGWDPVVTARARFPAVNNLFMRILPDTEARAFFARHGLPQVTQLVSLEASPGAPGWAWNRRMLTDPAFAAPREWLADAGTTTYLLWLLRHPLDRLDEVARDAWPILVPRELDGYMPEGWAPQQLPLTSNAGLVLALVLATPALLITTRGSALRSIAIVLLASGTVGFLAAYYGDGNEISRHCYGAAQQLLLGCALVVVAWADRDWHRRAPAEASQRT